MFTTNVTWWVKGQTHRCCGVVGSMMAKDLEKQLEVLNESLSTLTDLLAVLVKVCDPKPEVSLVNLQNKCGLRRCIGKEPKFDPPLAKDYIKDVSNNQYVEKLFNQLFRLSEYNQMTLIRVKSIHSIHAHLNSRDDDLKMLENELAQLENVCRFGKPPVDHSLCLVRDAGRFFRGLILTSNADFTVYLLDYGNVIEAQLSQLFQLDTYFTSHEAFAYQMHFARKNVCHNFSNQKMLTTFSFSPLS